MVFTVKFSYVRLESNMLMSKYGNLNVSHMVSVSCHKLKPRKLRYLLTRRE